MKFNTLASPTYSWLKMNGGELLDLPAMERLSPAIELPEGVRVEKLNGVAAKPLRTGGGAECGEALAATEDCGAGCASPLLPSAGRRAGV